MSRPTVTLSIDLTEAVEEMRTEMQRHGYHHIRETTCCPCGWTCGDLGNPRLETLVTTLHTLTYTTDEIERGES